MAIASRQHLEAYAENIPWIDIFGPAGFTSRKIDTLKNCGTQVLEWTYDDGELIFSLQTFGEDEPAWIIDWNHVGNPQLSKVDALRKFRGGDNWLYTKALITESVSIGENKIDKISRKLWEDYQQSSLEMSPEVRYISDPLFQGIVDQELSTMMAKDYARLKFDEMKFAQEGEPKPAISLRDLLALKIPANKFVVDQLLIKSGKVFFAAKAKSGKTTASLALLKSLADGDDFLGKFAVEPPEGGIGYLNLELTETQMQEWVTRQGIVNLDRVHFWNLRSKPSPFRSLVSRAHLIEEIQALGIKTLVIDTFAKIFPGQANDNSEVNRFLIMLDEVLEKAGVEQLVMLLHAGNDAKKIRGATALTDHPDGIWFLYNDEDKNRYFSATGRDIEVDEGQILYDKSTYRLNFTGTGKKETKESTAGQRMLEFIQANPGSNAATVDESVSGTKTYKIKVRNRLVKDGLAKVRKGPNNSNQYFAL